MDGAVISFAHTDDKPGIPTLCYSVALGLQSLVPLTNITAARATVVQRLANSTRQMRWFRFPSSHSFQQLTVNCLKNFAACNSNTDSLPGGGEARQENRQSGTQIAMLFA